MKIDIAFNHLLQTRINIIKVLQNNVQNATVIPKGFNNSLLWNAGHCIAAQQGLCYGLSALPRNASDEFINAFKKGSKAEDIAIVISVDELIKLLESTANQIIKDYSDGKFKNYTQYETSYGITLNNIEEAIAFNNVHEGLHLGYMMAMAKGMNG